MDITNKFSSSDDDFCFEVLHDEIDRIHRSMCDKECESSDESDDVVLGVRNRKIRVIDSDSDSDSDASQPDQSEWTPCDESAEIPPRINFVSGERPAGPRVSTNVIEPLDAISATSWGTKDQTAKIRREAMTVWCVEWWGTRSKSALKLDATVTIVKPMDTQTIL